MPWTETALTVPAEVQERYPITTAALEAIGHIVGVIHRAELIKVPLQELLPIEDPLALRDRPVELIEAQQQHIRTKSQHRLSQKPYISVR